MLDIRKREVGSVCVVSLSGDLDVFGAQNLKYYLSNLHQPSVKKVVFNWTDVKNVNFTSVQLVTRAFIELVNACPMAFCGMSNTIQTSLKTAPFFEKVQIFETEDRALTRL